MSYIGNFFALLIKKRIKNESKIQDSIYKADISVEITRKKILDTLEGDEEKINRLIEWANDGPANSRVESVEVQDEIFIGEFSKFDVLY